MPQVDLENLVPVCGGSDRKIACETLVSAVESSTKNSVIPDGDTVVQSDMPPESFCLSKDAEQAWLASNMYNLHKESTKVKTKSKQMKFISNSQRFSMNLKSAAAILGLPNPRKKSNVDAKRKNYKFHLFPKRSSGVGSTGLVTEPSSPKVSCVGRVRSMRGMMKSSEKDQKDKKRSEKGRNRFLSRLIAIFQCRCLKPNRLDLEIQKATAGYLPRNNETLERREIPVAAEAPGLGALRKTRYASGRRSGSVQNIDVATL